MDAMPRYRDSTVEITDPDVIAKSGTAFHPIGTYSGVPEEIVEGTVFSITEADLAAADAYEVSDYKRIRVLLKRGASAWVYVKA